MAKEFQTGLVIGKFLPFHRGHAYLIERALAQTEHLTIIICNTSKYVIPATLRKEWIQDAFSSADVRVLEHEEYLDSTSTDISQQWADITLDFLGFTPQAVFSSEDYGAEYAKCMGSKHIMVDKERIKYLISGTEIRKNPHTEKSWRMVNQEVRKMYAIRIAIVGAESTGTTTLAVDLAKHYQTVYVPEYGRFFSEGMLYVDDPDLWQSKDFEHIAKMQNRMEDALAKKCNRLLICDTNAWATGIWHLRYMGSTSEEVANISAGREYPLYIVTAPDIPFVQDGTRDGEHLREWMHEQFVETLTSEGKSFIVVEGSRENRLNLASSRIDEILNSTQQIY